VTEHHPSVLIVGDATRTEMQAALQRLADVLPGVALSFCRDVAAVEVSLASTSQHPELVLVCESWPDEFPATHASRLLTVLPLSRFVCLCGYWCESAGRTRSHWPPALRVPVWDAWSRIEGELQVLSGKRAALPWTATRDECVLDAAVPVLSPSSAAQRVSVRGQVRVEIYDSALNAELILQLQSSGWNVVSNPDTSVDMVLVSAEPASTILCAVISERCRAVAPASVWAVTTWPLPEWTEQLRAAGVQRVINPLALLEER
jgi:hypothetical protein